ncbi:MAG: hypothetical protein KGH75_00105 [Rhodospirillales bacterium]|nr:hypothetical protein [Rhodospirillales bacterium]
MSTYTVPAPTHQAHPDEAENADHPVVLDTFVSGWLGETPSTDEGAQPVGLCRWCGRYAYAVGGWDGDWVHGYITTHRNSPEVRFVLTPHGVTVPLDSASVGVDTQEGDTEVRYCTGESCGCSRMGTFGEVFAYEPMTMDYPGQAAGGTWICDHCGEEATCDLDAD